LGKKFIQNEGEEVTRKKCMKYRKLDSCCDQVGDMQLSSQTL